MSSPTLLTCREKVGGGQRDVVSLSFSLVFFTDLDVLHFPLCLAQKRLRMPTRPDKGLHGRGKMASPQEVFKKLRPPVGMIRDQFKGHFGSKKPHAACSCVEHYLPARPECVSAAPTGLGSQVT